MASHLEPDLVVCVPLAGDPVGDRVDDVNLEKVSRGGVCVIQGLLLAARTNNRLCKHANSGKDAKHMISRDDLSMYIIACSKTFNFGVIKFHLLSLLVASSPAMIDILEPATYYNLEMKNIPILVETYFDDKFEH